MKESEFDQIFHCSNCKGLIQNHKIGISGHTEFNSECPNQKIEFDDGED